jgi:anti-sigma regulatory factor (Ser/Thr protein kinase)
MIFEARIELLQTMIAWICDSVRLMGFNRSALQKIELASEEALVNIIRHAYQERPEKIEIDVKIVPKSRVEIVIKDYGPPFNPLKEKVNLSDKLEEREPGGLGIHLMRQCMDEVRYQREPDANVLTLVKKIGEK